MGKHRLMSNYSASDTVRFFDGAGWLWHTGERKASPKPEPRAGIGRTVDVGASWMGDEA